MTEDDRQTNERIARACGWAPCVYGWCRMCGPNHDTAQTPRVPDYLADPSRLPEMEKLCEDRGWSIYTFNTLDHPGGSARTRVVRLSCMYKGLRSRADGTTTQRAFARALDAALQAEEGE